MAVSIPNDLLSFLKETNDIQIYKPNLKIFTQGDKASHFYIVAKGRVRVYTVSTSGKERTIEILEAGRIFGDSSFLTDSKRKVTIEAVITSEIISLPSEKLIEMCTESVPLMKLIFQHMADTCNYLTHQVVQSGHYNSVQKVCDFLLIESENRQKNILPYTHEEIAASTSLNRVTVSRIISKLKNKNIVEIKYGSIEILDRAALKEILPDE